MHDRALRTPEPANPARSAAPRHDAIKTLAPRFPTPVNLPLAQSLQARDRRAAGNDDVVPRDCDVMQHRGMRHVETHRRVHLAGLVEGTQKDIARSQAARLVPEGDQLPGLWIEFRMGRECLALPASAEVFLPERLQRVGIDAIRQAVFFRRVQPSTEDDGSRVGARAFARTGDIAHWHLVCVGIAVVAVELPARRELPLEAVRAHIPATIVDDAAPKTEHADVPVSGKTGLIRELGRIEPIEVHSVERTVEVARDRAAQLAIEHFRIEAPRTEIPGRGRRREIDHD